MSLFRLACSPALFSITAATCASVTSAMSSASTAGHSTLSGTGTANSVPNQFFLALTWWLAIQLRMLVRLMPT